MFLFNSWLDPLFWKGFCRHELTHEDLYATPGEAASKKMLVKFNR